MNPFDLLSQQQSIESKLVVALERISEAFRVMLWQHSKEQGLSPIQIQILIFCRYHDRSMCKVGYLAREFNMTKATVSDSVKVLQKKGLIGKEPEPQDNRSYGIIITPKGEQLLKQVAPFAGEMVTALKGLSSLEKTNMFSGLLRVIHHLNHQGIISIQRMCHTCRFYQRSLQGPYCNFLQQPLRDKDLRIDCPVYQDKE